MIGIDLDNTIISYDRIYRNIAKERGLSVGDDQSARSILKADCFRKEKGNLEWSLLQGQIYGKRIFEAEVFPGVIETFRALLAEKATLCIISHKTRYPGVGEAYDFRRLARAFLKKELLSHFTEEERARISLNFCGNQLDKWHMIRRRRCAYFIDDLKPFLSDDRFPEGVKRIFFSSDSVRSNESFEYTAENWDEIRRYFSGKKVDETIYFSDDTLRGIDFKLVLKSLLAEAQGSELKSSKPLAGGINNRVFKIETNNGEIYCAKFYKRNPDDPRDRMLNEVRFLEYCEANEISCVAKIVAKDWAQRAVLMTYVEGTRWPEDKVVPKSIWRQFEDFYCLLQQFRETPSASLLPRAAEGACSIKEHLGWLQRRRDYWRSLAIEGDLEADIAHWILNEMEDAYQKVAERSIGNARFSEHFTDDRRVISPSDFGLHNALVDEDAKVWFIDFEYAGWDDAAKAQIDFFLQPRYSAPDSLIWPFDRSNDEDYSCIKAILELKWKYIIFSAQQNIGLLP